MPVSDRNPAVYIPEVGDVLRYRYGMDSVEGPVTEVAGHGGFTDIWIGHDHDVPPLFNVNHTTGMANTTHNGGRWALIRKASEATETVELPGTMTLDEDGLAESLHALLCEHITYGETVKIVAQAIKVKRAEAA